MTRAELNEVVEPLLEPHSKELREMALEGAWILSQRLHPADLLVYDNYNAVALGWSYTGKTGDCKVMLPVGSYKMRLGFGCGDTLYDPERRLLGEGTVFRSIILTSLDMLDDPYICRLIEDATAMAKKGESSGQVILKSVSPKKRRPPRG